MLQESVIQRRGWTGDSCRLSRISISVYRPVQCKIEFVESTACP